MSIATLIAVILILAAIVTLVPRPAARKKCGLGYRALCPFAPMSTAALVMTAGVVWVIGSLA